MRTMKSCLALVGFSMLIAGCDYLPFGGPTFISDALKKAPLPPGTSQFEFHGDNATEFSINASYSDRNAAEIADFYRSYFKDNGWTSNFPPDRETDDLLDFRKGKANMNVTTVAMSPEIHLVVIYRENDYTREEFDTLAREGLSPEVKAFIGSVHAAYESARSYTDTGTHEIIGDGDLLRRATFKTTYRDPGDLLFEHWDSTDDAPVEANVLSKKGDLVQRMSGTDSEPRVEADISTAIAALYGVTSGTSGNIPEFLLHLDGSTVFHLVDLAIIGEARSVNGPLCDRLRGKDISGAEVTFWIGKDDHLIRKIESMKDRKNREITTYSPRINVEVSDADLAIKKPETRLGEKEF